MKKIIVTFFLWNIYKKEKKELFFFFKRIKFFIVHINMFLFLYNMYIAHSLNENVNGLLKLKYLGNIK